MRRAGYLTRKTPSRRSKVIARRPLAGKPYLIWSAETQAYEVGIEFTNSHGETYTVLMHQLEWEELAKDVADCFKEATA